MPYSLNKIFGLFIGFSILCTSFAYAEEQIALHNEEEEQIATHVDENTENNDTCSTNCTDLLCNHSMWDDLVVRLSYRGKRGLGYRRGYGTLGLFYFPYSQCEDSQPIVDVRLHRIDDGQFASNAGLGYRKRFCEDIVGVNAFYDYRGSLGSYHQLGIGAEWFTRCWEFRVNGYFPLGKARRNSVHNFDYPGGAVARRHIRDFSFALVEAEAGTRWNIACWNLFTGVGPYYMKSRYKGNAYGVRWRAQTILWNTLAVEVLGTYDHIFKNRAQVYVGIDIPVKIVCNFKEFFARACGCLCEDKMRMPIYRNELIVLKRTCFWRTNY